MISIEKCNYGKDNENKRKELINRGYISSVMISKHSEKYGIPNPVGSMLRKFKKLCEYNDIYHCIELHISGTIKNWFKESQITDMVTSLVFKGKFLRKKKCESK